MATKQVGLGEWIRRTLKEEPPRSKSLMVTIFGDSIVPYATGIWLSELIALLRPFHVNERLARTSCLRLAEEGWLESKRDGRLSRYELTHSGLQRVQLAYHRIYDPPPNAWDGNWTLVMQSRAGNPTAERVELRRELEWEGFGTLGLGIYIHPCADPAALREVIERLKLQQNVIVMQARDLDTVAACPAHRLASECWKLEEVASQYEVFLKRFSPVLPLLASAPEPLTAFVVQTLLIHSFRRVTLHDPRLPAVLLDPGWPGGRAFELCREIYRRTWQQVRLHLAGHLEHTAIGGPKPNAEFFKRFGQLDR